MSDSPQSDAAKRAAARKAKILARGNTGLQRLAQTARGEEAEALYGSDGSRPTSPGSETKTKSTKPSSSTSPSTTSPSGAAGLTPEQQQMQNDLFSMFGNLGGPGGPGGPGAGGMGGDGGMPDMSRLLAQMMGMEQPPAGQNLLGDMDDPAGLGSTPPFPGFPGFGGMGDIGGMGGLPPLPGMDGLGMGMGMGGLGGRTKSTTERYFPIVHVLSMVALALLTVVWWEPSLRGARWAGKVDSWWARRWGGLAGRQGWVKGLAEELLGGVESLPLFWAFTMVELILQTTRIMILRSPPPPHSLISTFLPLLPPAIARPLVTGSRYLSLLSQTYKDGALLIFLIGLTIILGQWRSTGVAPFSQTT